MNKTDLIRNMATKSGLTKGETARALEAFIETVTETLKGGENVALVGFGDFHVSERAAREGRNPQTGDVIQIAATKTPAFKAGKQLKDAVNA